MSRLLAVLLALVLAIPASAQQRPEVAPGSRVRITMSTLVDGAETGRTEFPSVGRVLSVDTTSITAVLERDGTEFTAPYSAIRLLQVSGGAMPAAEGRRPGLRTGMLIGGGVTVAGYAILYVLTQVRTEDPTGTCRAGVLECVDDGSPILPYMIPVVAGGTIGGALLGFSLGGREREAWHPVRTRDLRPSEVRVSASLAF